MNENRKQTKADHAINGMKAFTLVELLVVISIIALLLAVLMPALQKARDQANRLVCKANQHQVSIAFFSYATDNKKYPLGNAWNVPNNFPEASYEAKPDPSNTGRTVPDYSQTKDSENYFFGNLLRNYLDKYNLTLFICPANKKMRYIRSEMKQGRWIGQGATGIFTGYFYFGNYPMEAALVGDAKVRSVCGMTFSEWTEYSSGKYPKTLIQAKRAKLMQDMIYSSKKGYWTGYGTNHEKPACLYTDGSVDEQERTKLKEYRREVLSGVTSIYLW